MGFNSLFTHRLLRTLFTLPTHSPRWPVRNNDTYCGPVPQLLNYFIRSFTYKRLSLLNSRYKSNENDPKRNTNSRSESTSLNKWPGWQNAGMTGGVRAGASLAARETTDGVHCPGELEQLVVRIHYSPLK